MDFDDAIQMGRRNKEIIDLFSNWCAHITVAVVGGVGLYEQMSGLPIGMRGFRCPHARGHGIAGMQLENVALDFFDRNCAGCDKRVAVRLPNITELVNARDGRVAKEEAERTRAAAIESSELESRIAARAALRSASDHTRNSVLDLMDAFDRDPTEASLRAMLESARAVPLSFAGDVENALFALAACAGRRASGALEVLDVVAQDRKRLNAAALQVLSRGGIDRVAGDIVAKGIEPENHAFVAEAVPSLIYIARPPYPRMPGLKDPPVIPGPLVAAFRAVPHAVITGLRRWLRDGEKEKRRSAAIALVELMKASGSAVALALVSDLIASFAQRDDPYDGGEASTTVARVLAKVMRHHPSEVDRELREAFATGDPLLGLGVAQTYASLFRADRAARRGVGRPTVATQAQRLAFDWIVSTVSKLPGDSRIADQLLTVLSDDYALPWDVAANAGQALLGTVALAHEQLESPPPEGPVKDPRPEVLRQLERQGRNVLLQNIIQSALGLIQNVTTHHPNVATRLETLQLLTEMLERIPEKAEALRAQLTGTLGAATSGPVHAAITLPLIYRGMTDPSVRVRRAALAAYSDLAERIGSENVPTLLHELAVSMLSDPFVLVHHQAVEAFESVRVPDDLVLDAAKRTVGVIRAHLDRKGGTASKALALWLRLLRRRGELTAADETAALQVIRKLDPNEAARFLTNYSGMLRRGVGYPDVLLAVLANDRRWDSSSSRLLELAEELTRDEVVSHAEGFVALAEKFEDRDNPEMRFDADVAAACFHILAKHQCWEQAIKVANVRVDAVPDTTANQPWRLRLQVQAEGVALEGAAASGMHQAVVQHSARMRELARLIAADEERNADARGLFPFARRPPSRD